MNKELNVQEKIISRIQELKKSQQTISSQLSQLENQRQQLTAQLLAVAGAIQELEGLLKVENNTETTTEDMSQNI